MSAVVELVHPQINLLARTGRGVAGTYHSVLAGKWGAAADLCGSSDGGSKVIDLDAARDRLDGAAQFNGFGSQEIDPPIIGKMVADDRYRMAGEERDVTNALDLFMRILCGQWAEMDYIGSLANSTPRKNGWEPLSLNVMRGDLFIFV